MRECKDFECKYISESGDCEPLASECIGDMCEGFQDCHSCTKQDAEECPRVDR